MPIQLSNILKRYSISITSSEARRYMQEIKLSQNYFPQKEQYALIVKLLKSWEKRGEEKILIFAAPFAAQKSFPTAYVFGIVSSDWPGLSNSCIGVIHEKGWNIHFANGITIKHRDETLGVMLIGILLENEHDLIRLQNQSNEIIANIKNASVGSQTKRYLLEEEIKKLQIFSSVIDKIEELYHKPDSEKLVGIDGEAIKFFSARSRDYIENRYSKDIAAQIILNHTLQEKARRDKTKAMQVEIKNYSTKKEGIFTAISIAGRANQVLLDDCLKSIEACCPGFQMKHHKDFTSDDGITVHRFEILTNEEKPLTKKQFGLLQEVFKNMERTRRHERQDWLETIGGFEHYARAIIPFLVRENERTDSTQVYMSVNQTSEKAIDFKILIVLTTGEISTKKLIYQCVNNLDSITGFSVSAVKPPKNYGTSEFTIIDLHVELAVTPEIEIVYTKVKHAIKKSIGDFRDFDEGMRQMDTTNLINVCKYSQDVSEDFVREFYYSLEDFYRVSAPVEEIGLQLKLCMRVINAIVPDSQEIFVQSENVEMQGDKKASKLATVMIVAYPTELDLLGRILNRLENYEVVISKLRKKHYNILICRLTEKSKALNDSEVNALTQAIKAL